MEKKQDPRTVQTKARIKQTLLDMMKKTAFNKVTVSEWQDRRDQPRHLLSALL